MQLPPVDAVGAFCAQHGIIAERELLVRASETYWRREARLQAGEEPRISVTDIAEWQVAEAIWDAVGLVPAVLTWPWDKLQGLIGDLLAGEVWVVGASTGNGKSTFIDNLITALVARSRGHARMTVATLEERAARVKRKLACLELGYDIPAVFRKQWWRLGVPEKEAKARLVEALARQARPPLRESVRFCPADTLGRAGLAALIEQAHEWHHRLVIVDHLHHLEHGDGPEHRGIRETMKLAKTLANRYGMTILFTAQLNRGDTRDKRRSFYPPQLSDLQGASAIEQVADGVLLLYRPLRPGIKAGELDDVVLGQREWGTVFQPHSFAVRCAKHRLDGDKRNRDIVLHLQYGRLTDEQPDFGSREPFTPGDAYEPEAAT
jgi:KaiC/GvpD/RAD55 family RecA-like ATPase